MTAPSIKMAVFMDKVAELMVLSMKRDVFMDERIAQKKETPRKDVSVYGVEQGGTVEKPWPPVAS